MSVLYPHLLDSIINGGDTMFLKRRDSGITLTELIVGIAVSGILMAMISSIIISINKNYQKYQQSTAESYENRSVINNIKAIVNKSNLEGKSLKLVIHEDTITIGFDESDQSLMNYNKNENKIEWSNTTSKLEQIENIKLKYDTEKANALTVEIYNADDELFSQVFYLVNEPKLGA